MVIEQVVVLVSGPTQLAIGARIVLLPLAAQPARTPVADANPPEASI